MPDIENLLKNLDQRQLRQINSFLNTPKGKQLKDKINSSDKEKLIREFSKLDQNTVNSRLKGLSQKELMDLINKL